MQNDNTVSAPDFRFPKDARLHHRSLVEGLFRNGNSFYEFPFRVIWRLMDNSTLEKNFRNKIPAGIGALQMMVTVPKKKRRRAVDRVLMRRRIREAFRLNRHDLKKAVEMNPDIATMAVAFVYVHDKNIDSSIVASKMESALEKLLTKISKK